MRERGWTEEEVAERILPYMPRTPPATGGGEIRSGAAPAIFVPPKVSSAWLDRTLPGMDREQIRLVIDELERRGWPATDVTVAVLPHLLPKLGRADADAILGGLRELGMTDEELARLTPDPAPDPGP